MTWDCYLKFAFLSAIVPVVMFAAGNAAKDTEGIMRGPLRITADETVSKERGKIIEASGNVAVRYVLESGDVIESFSKAACYNEKEFTGELSGNPKAKWIQAEQGKPETDMTADKILLKMKEEGLVATGNVVVVQASTTLRAQEVRFSNREKKLVASGGSPEFEVRDVSHHTKISAEEIIALSEKKQVNFIRHVHGVVLLSH